MERDNPYAEARRIEKAMILTDALFAYSRKLGVALSPEDVDAIEPEVWAALTEECNRNPHNNLKRRMGPPSAETLAAVKAMIARRNRNDAKPDPFKRFR